MCLVVLREWSLEHSRIWGLLEFGALRKYKSGYRLHPIKTQIKNEGVSTGFHVRWRKEFLPPP